MSLSKGKCKKATRKAVVYVLLNSASLRGQFILLTSLPKLDGIVGMASPASSACRRWREAQCLILSPPIDRPRNDNNI